MRPFDDEREPQAARDATDAAPASMPDTPIPLIPPTSREPFILLIFGLLCFALLISFSWLSTQKATVGAPRRSGRGTRDEYQLSVDARYQTYLVAWLQQQRLHGPLADLPILKDYTVQTAKQGADDWRQVYEARGSGDDKVRVLLNVAALQGVVGHNATACATLRRSAQEDASLAPVVRDLLPLYAHPTHAVPFSAATQRELQRLSSAPLLLARAAQVRGNLAGARAALQPGAEAGLRVLVYLLVNTLLIVGVLIAALSIGMAHYPRIVRHLRKASAYRQPELPWGPGMALVLICLVFLCAGLFTDLVAHQCHLVDEPRIMLVGAAMEIMSAALVLGVFLVLLGRKPWDWSLFGWQRSLRGVRFAVLTLVCASPLVWLAGYLSAWVFGGESATHPLIPMLQNSHSWLWQLALGLMVVVIAPVVEETLFRGLLFRALGVQRPFWSAALISGVLFGLIHGQLGAILPITLLGLALALILGRTHNLLASVTAHALQNGYVTIITLLSAWALHGPG